ncbi:MAG: hypothetical protein AB1567_04055, partial [bacterium]
EEVGLKWVQNGGKIITKKVATQRKVKDIPFEFFCSVARQINKERKRLKVPIQFLGKELTQNEFDDFVNERVKLRTNEIFDYKVNREVNKRVTEKTQEITESRDRINQFFAAIRGEIGTNYDTAEPEVLAKALILIKNCSFANNMFEELKEMKEKIERILLLEK